ncbi:MAG: hypothetical protein MR021_01545 [Clostridiales bacterium]|nr:hypothetical protein [Clostridiales bacterium]
MDCPAKGIRRVFFSAATVLPADAAGKTAETDYAKCDKGRSAALYLTEKQNNTGMRPVLAPPEKMRLRRAVTK